MKLLAILAVFVSFSTARASRRLIFNNEENRSFKNCGVVSEDDSNNEHFSWDAEIVLNQNKSCPAIFITKRTLISHASCVQSNDSENISVTIHVKHSKTEIKANLTFFKHFDFNKTGKSEFDFAVVSLKVGQNITPICLWSVPEILATESITEYNPATCGKRYKSKIVQTNVCWRQSLKKKQQNLRKSGEIVCTRSRAKRLKKKQRQFLIKKQENIWYLRGLRRQGVAFLNNTLSAYNDIADSIEWIATSSKYISVLPKQTKSSTRKYDFKTDKNLSSPNCGLINVPTYAVNEVEPLVAGGQIAKYDSHPWYALIEVGDEESPNICGGTLIKENVILTAAHCLYLNNTLVAEVQVRAKFGVRDLYDNTDKSILTLQPKQIIVHEKYCLSCKDQNDIALLIFDETKDITKQSKNNLRISTLCLWNGDGSFDKNTNGTFFGFGMDETNYHPNNLQSIVLPIIQHKKCFQKGSHSLYNNYLIPGKTFCAGYLSQNKSTCRGDSGGGLAIKVNNRWFLRGIVSVGVKAAPNTCNPNYYTIFVDIHHYLQWIEDNSMPNHLIPNAEKLTTWSASEQYYLPLKEIAYIAIILICVSISSVLATLMCRCQNRSHSERRRFSQTV